TAFYKLLYYLSMGRPVKHEVRLSAEEEQQLKVLTSKGKTNARVVKRAHILRLSHEGKTVQDIMDALHVTHGTINNIRKKYCDHGLAAALFDAARPGRPEKFDGKDRAGITGIACSEAPEGHAKWSVRLIRDQAVELGVVDGIAPSTVFYILKKTKSSRTAKGRGA
ncbi:helix-turn-helix domain-containing protein, partial [Deinococcus xinjiangensis]